MNELFTASRTVDLAESLFARVKPTTVYQFLAEGNSRHYNVEVIPINGVLERTLETEDMVYKPIEESDVFIPDWVQERIDWAIESYEVKQIIIGDEKEEPLSKEQEAIRQAVQQSKAILKVLAIGVAGILAAIFAAQILAFLAGIIIVATLGLAVMVLGGAGVLLLDPQVCVILADDPKERWICVAQWVH